LVRGQDGPIRDQQDDLVSVALSPFLCVFWLVLQQWNGAVPTHPTENRASCNNCVTADEWKAGIADYYANGGGINFDFTVAQETKDLWAGK
jgi:hypothetical protein